MRSGRAPGAARRIGTELFSRAATRWRRALFGKAVAQPEFVAQPRQQQVVASGGAYVRAHVIRPDQPELAEASHAALSGCYPRHGWWQPTVHVRIGFQVDDARSAQRPAVESKGRAMCGSAELVGAKRLPLD